MNLWEDASRLQWSDSSRLLCGAAVDRTAPREAALGEKAFSVVTRKRKVLLCLRPPRAGGGAALWEVSAEWIEVRGETLWTIDWLVCVLRCIKDVAVTKIMMEKKVFQLLWSKKKR